MAVLEALSSLVFGNKASHGPACAVCLQLAVFACKNCLLVAYCSARCRKAHWPEHSADCCSPLLQADWEPLWATEDRCPRFVEWNGRSLPKTRKHYLYGNIPAYDVVQLAKNEGAEYKGDLNLLFAASGDLRNAITSINAMPSTYKGSLNIIINDLDFSVVARNIIILLIALTFENDVQAVECILHLLYSASIRKVDMDTIAAHVRPLIADVVRKIALKDGEALLGKTWKFCLHTFRVELVKSQWDALLRYLEVPPGLTAQSAKIIRTTVTLAPGRLDLRERRMLRLLQPAHRMCFQKFWGHGILLPFAHSRDEFTVPNPTFYQSPMWPMKPDSDPAAGWDTLEITNTDVGPARNDFYGKVFTLVSRKLHTFRDQLCMQKCNFRLTSVNALELPGALADSEVSRIEPALHVLHVARSSNISDAGYIGVKQTVEAFGSLLQGPEINPHATLITLFMNVTLEVFTSEDARAMVHELSRRVEEYMPRTHPARSLYDPDTITRLMAMELVHDVEDEFWYYMQWQDFDSVERAGLLEMKEEHSIIEEWPLRLKLKPEEEGAREEFERMLSFPHFGQERYVEWKVKWQQQRVDAEGERKVTMESLTYAMCARIQSRRDLSSAR